MCNLLFLNIIIAFVIDTYSSIEETLQQEKRQRTKKIQKMDMDDEDKSLLRELNDNPGQFTRIMQILNSKGEETPRNSKQTKFRISNMNRNLNESRESSPLDTESRYSIISENAKATKMRNQQELGSFYKKLRDGMQKEDSDSEFDSEGTSEMLTEDVEND